MYAFTHEMRVFDGDGARGIIYQISSWNGWKGNKYIKTDFWRERSIIFNTIKLIKKRDSLKSLQFYTPSSLWSLIYRTSHNLHIPHTIPINLSPYNLKLFLVFWTNKQNCHHCIVLNHQYFDLQHRIWRKRKSLV